MRQDDCYFHWGGQRRLGSARGKSTADRLSNRVSNSVAHFCPNHFTFWPVPCRPNFGQTSCSGEIVRFNVTGTIGLDLTPDVYPNSKLKPEHCGSEFPVEIFMEENMPPLANAPCFIDPSNIR